MRKSTIKLKDNRISKKKNDEKGRERHKKTTFILVFVSTEREHRKRQEHRKSNRSIIPGHDTRWPAVSRRDETLRAIRSLTSTLRPSATQDAFSTTWKRRKIKDEKKEDEEQMIGKQANHNDMKKVKQEVRVKKRKKREKESAQNACR